MVDQADRFYERRPWLSSYDDGVPHRLTYPDENIPELFAKTAAIHAERVALRFMGRSLRFRELKETASAVARRLRDIGVETGDRVLLFLPNTPHFVACYLGILECGAVAVPASPLDTAPELEYKLRDSDAKVVFYLDLFHDRVEPLLAVNEVKAFVAADIADYLPFPKRQLFPLRKKKLAPKLPSFNADPRLQRFRDFVKAGSRLADHAPANRSGNDLAAILYTGGTTGVSKGVMLSHTALVVNQAMARSWVEAQGNDVMLAVLPFFHGFGLSVCLNLSMVHGMTIVLHLRFDPGAVLKDLVKEGVTIFAGVPTMYRALVDHPHFDTLRNCKLRGCFVGAASTPEPLKKRFEEGSGSVLIEGYGLTEAVTAKTANPYRGEKKQLSVGLPWPDVEMKVVDPDSGETLPACADGELLLKSPDLMTGYWNADAATADVLKDGWLYTGDIAHFDEDGYLYIVDRKKDLIICGGHNVYPTEIEELLAKLPEIKLSCVVGIDDEHMGEVPKAFIVLQPDAELGADELRTYLEERLVKYKVPRHYEFRNELPLSPIGKVLRKQLRQTER